MPFNPTVLPIGNGSAQYDGGTPERSACPNCEGEGEIMVSGEWHTCPDCDGTGKTA
jgi:DnaJ-class molecular chaperone